VLGLIIYTECPVYHPFRNPAELAEHRERAKKSPGSGLLFFEVALLPSEERDCVGLTHPASEGWV
jgi:hypothetical protein